jgi:hypothetical protein
VSEDGLSSRQSVRRLINGAQAARKVSDGGARAAAAACDTLYRGLSRWVGTVGCHALFTRALAVARADSDALDEIKLRQGAEPYVDGIQASIESHGDASTADALESVLVHLVELLGRMIGKDMATTLIERSIASPDSDATSNDRREEA